MWHCCTQHTVTHNNTSSYPQHMVKQLRVNNCPVTFPWWWSSSLLIRGAWWHSGGTVGADLFPRLNLDARSDRADNRQHKRLSDRTAIISFAQLPTGVPCTRLHSLRNAAWIEWRHGTSQLKIFAYVLGRLVPNYYSKAVPLQAWSGPEGFMKLRFPDFMKTAQVRL